MYSVPGGWRCIVFKSVGYTSSIGLNREMMVVTSQLSPDKQVDWEVRTESNKTGSVLL